MFVLRRAVCTQVVPYRKGTVQLVGEMSYTALEGQLDADASGAAVCGSGFHVCNYQEVTVNGVIHNEDLGGTRAWIVGAHGGSDQARRALWDGQDSTQCQQYNAPQWYGRWGPYRGRVSCASKDGVAQVACCSNQPDREEAAVKPTVGALTYWSLQTELDQDWRGRGVCGADWHVCNYAEATVYGTMKSHAFQRHLVWIVGQFPNLEYHRRSIWNGQDSTFCAEGTYPAWVSNQGPYHGVVRCENGATNQPVACCKDRMQPVSYTHLTLPTKRIG
eukprot:TRINITY_DN8004_c0_g1_i2.p1 TRINITY_DN8004_c0_g1~~TRINITY_DN8004_c0_g1_i2.p1  ORF type:complete len:275 (-),score=46.44 TRINITY_DN8004_c0_g1_i2:42-866(-)